MDIFYEILNKYPIINSLWIQVDLDDLKCNYLDLDSSIFEKKRDLECGISVNKHDQFKFHSIRSKNLPMQDFELTGLNLYADLTGIRRLL